MKAPDCMVRGLSSFRAASRPPLYANRPYRLCKAAVDARFEMLRRTHFVRLLAATSLFFASTPALAA